MTTRMSRALAIALALILAAALSGCAGTGETSEPVVTPPPASEQPTAEPGTDGGAAGGTTLNAEELVSTKCSMCHTLDRVDSASYDAAGWTTVVERMQKNGLVISEEEKALIIEYLAGR